MSNDDSTKRVLRILTYLCPEMPVALYATYQRYLETALNCRSYLMTETYRRGPELGGLDPFTLDEADIVFAHGSSYVKLSEEGTSCMELLPVAPVHVHRMANLDPVYYSDVIVHKDNAKKFKEFINLKGHIWGYNDETSMSGNVQVLAELKRKGFNASFFGHIVHTGSAVNSIEMVRSHAIQAAAVDSSVLDQYMLQRPYFRDSIHVLTSFGPLPAQPILVNSRLSAENKRLIADKLLGMNESETWKEELAKFNVWGFKPIDQLAYDRLVEVSTQANPLSLHTIYY